jgi:hypothetical protein
VEASKTNPRLYDYDADIGEATNLADNHADVVEKLIKLAATMTDEISGQAPKSRRPAGEVGKPQPLYPVNEVPKAKDPAKPAALDKLKHVGAVPSGSAPQIAGKAITLSCEIETDLRDTVVVAHGGASAGYALHLKKGCVVFSVRTGDEDTITEINELQSATIKGPVKITETVGREEALTLAVGEQAVVKCQVTGPVPRQPAKDFCVGHDNGQPDANYTMGKPFVGKITDLKVASH